MITAQMDGFRKKGRSFPDISHGPPLRVFTQPGSLTDWKRCPRRVRFALAGSTGRRNTGVNSLSWGFELQGLTWPFV
jgi:hypothetical protein